MELCPPVHRIAYSASLCCAKENHVLYSADCIKSTMMEERGRIGILLMVTSMGTVRCERERHGVGGGGYL